jgi:hypothetical protein
MASSAKKRGHSEEENEGPDGIPGQDPAGLLDCLKLPWMTQ